MKRLSFFSNIFAFETAGVAGVAEVVAGVAGVVAGVGE